MNNVERITAQLADAEMRLRKVRRGMALCSSAQARRKEANIEAEIALCNTHLDNIEMARVQAVWAADRVAARLERLS